jgi:mono/diheme cytochrome c family protein
MMRRTLFSTLLLAASTWAQGAGPAVPAGLAVFSQQCAACHQADGKGTPGLAPALAGPLAPLLGSEEGRRYVSLVLVQGLSGKIVSQGQTFVGAMPSQAALTDAELSDVANHLARDLNATPTAAFTAADFARAREARTTHKELRELRTRLMP